MTTTEVVGEDEKVRLGKVNEDLVNKALEKAGLKAPKKLEAKVKLLEGHFEKTVKKAEDLVVCDTCNATSDVNLDACPFCGEVDGPTQQPSAVAGGAEPKANGTNGSAAMTKGASVSLRTEADLNKAVAELQGLAHEAGKNTWMFWQKVREVHDQETWKLRTDETGKVAYKTFDQFVRTELKINKVTAYQMLKVAERFTEQQVEELGPAKLKLIAQVKDPAEEKRLLDQAKAGASKREIEKQLPRERKGPPPAKAKPAKDGKPAAETEAITVATMLRKQRIRLYRKPDGVQRKKWDPKEMKLARKVSETPVGWMDLANDVRQYFQLEANAAGEVQLVIETVRHAVEE